MNSRPLWAIAVVLVGVAILLGVLVSEIKHLPGGDRAFDTRRAHARDKDAI